MNVERPGLRERKKQQTREAIQDHALRLYQEQGYAATTVEQIADAANVSPSTFFRYFPTKPETVLYDRVDPIFVEVLLAQPEDLSLPAAIRASIHEAFGRLGEEGLSLELTRTRLVAQVPELRAAAAQRVEASLPLFTDAIARRVGRDPADRQVLLWMGALAGVVLAAVFDAVMRDADVLAAIDGAVAFLEAGLPL